MKKATTGQKWLVGFVGFIVWGVVYGYVDSLIPFDNVSIVLQWGAILAGVVPALVASFVVTLVLMRRS